MRHLSLSVLFLAAACGGDGDTKSKTPSAAVDIKPTDFAIVPCGGYDAARPCAMVRAGGKRVLIGAPGGIGQSLATEDFAKLDSVLLFSLQAADIEGLGELRNRSWSAGRETALTVSGPHGTRDMVVAVNKMFEVADVRHAETLGRKSDQKAAMLEPVAGERETKAEVFDTGDLVITHVQNADGLVGYWVDYDGRRAILEPCGMTQARQFGGEADVTIACDREGAPTANWPLTQTLRIEPRANKPDKTSAAIS